MKINVGLVTTILILLLACNYTPFPQGGDLYESQCSGCHGIEGEGFRDLYPPLRNSISFQNDPYQTACIITNGIRDTVNLNGEFMKLPMFAIEGLTEVQITNIINYIAHSWNPEVKTPVNIDLVKQSLEACKDQPKVF